MYEVSYNGRTSSACEQLFYRRFRSEGMLYDTERDLAAIAKCLVLFSPSTAAWTTRRTARVCLLKLTDQGTTACR